MRFLELSLRRSSTLPSHARLSRASIFEDSSCVAEGHTDHSSFVGAPETGPKPLRFDSKIKSFWKSGKFLECECGPCGLLKSPSDRHPGVRDGACRRRHPVCG